MSNNCFSTLNGYEVKDAYARQKNAENAQAIADMIPTLEQMMSSGGKVPFTVYPEQYGAVGDGVHDDVEAINAALAENLSVSLLPGKTYAINGASGVIIPENGNLYGNGATIKVIPNNLQIYTGVYMGGSNSRMENVNLVGERTHHTGEGGEWGHGLSIGGNADGVVVRDCKISDFWGDGIYVNLCSNVLIENVVVDNSRRNGISVISAKNFKCLDSIFSNTNGTNPQSGIGIEANYDTDVLENVEFIRCRSINSASGTGIYSTVRKSGSTVVYRECETDKAFAFTGITGTGSTFVAENCKFGGTVYLSSNDGGNEFYFRNCYIKGSSGLPIVNTLFTAQTDRTLFDSCVFDGSAGSAHLIRQERGYLSNFSIKRSVIKDATLGRPVIYWGDKENGANNHIEVHMENSTFGEPSIPMWYGNLNTCTVKVTGQVREAYQYTGLYCRDNVVKSYPSGGPAVTFVNGMPGDFHTLTNQCGRSDVWFAWDREMFINGASVGTQYKIPNGATLIFYYTEHGTLHGWLA